ncbi:MAG TPA: methionine adenosyltransferase [Longimicrobiales bacterium]|nr:methionine adenosyltransferase [Longimicrobiales bacterium]
MAVHHGLFTSEAVSAGHPDKLCDRISDAILDAFLHRDPDARVACEAFAADGKIVVAGEFRTTDPRHYDEVRDESVGIVRRVLKHVGYGTAEHDIDPDTCEVEIRFNRQSEEIGAGVDRADFLGAGDQGLMFGYATDETDERMPLAWSLATDLIARGSALRATGESPLKPDAKSQVTVRYEDGAPVGIQTVVVSWQHQPETSLEDVRAWLLRHVVDEVVPSSMRTHDFRCLLNPAGPWTTGGPKGDTGLTGRKIIVDTYGGACPHGGGAFSGKDPSKVDRSGAYAARWVAGNVVAAGLARRCTVQLAYAIGVADPVSVNVNTHGTARVPERAVEGAIPHVFELTPAGIIRDLDLSRPIYTETSSLGHFGRWRDPATYRWERADRAERLAAEVV